MEFSNKSNFRTMMGCLIINGKRYPLYEGINTIGRCLTATVSLKSLDISKQHAIVTIVNNNDHYVSDFQSFNGTFLKKSKLSPLLLYKLSQNSAIQFGNVTAIYNKISTDTKKHNGLSEFHNTQCASQSLYDANTQAVEDEIPNQNLTVDLEQPQNYFDDDFSFDDISTQMIDEANTSKSPVFKIPLSIRDVAPQRLCDKLPIPEDPTDIHDMATQKFEIEVPLSTHDVIAQEFFENDNLPNAENPTDIHDMETQTFEIEVPLSTHDVTAQKHFENNKLPTNIHDMETQKFDIEVSISTHNVTTQKLCDVDTLTTAKSSTDIHDLETQKFEIEPILSTHNVTTQKLCDVDTLTIAKSFTDIHDSETQKCEIEVPLSTHDVTTQKPCAVDKLPIPDDPTDMEAQNIQMASNIDIDNVNDMSKQTITFDKEQEDFDTTSIIDETVLDNSQLEIAQVTILAKVASQDSDSQSKLHLSQLRRRSINPIPDTQEELLNNSEIVCNAESSEDEILCKSKKKVNIIESDNETDIEDLDENIKNNRINDSGSDTDVEGLEKSINEHSPIVDRVQKSPTLYLVNNTITGTDSDTDIDDFEFNTQMDDIKKIKHKGLENHETHKDDDCIDEIIPGTQFADEDIFSESLASNNAHELDQVLNVTKLDDNPMVNSVDMDSLYLEPTQSIIAPSSNVLVDSSEALVQSTPQLVEDENESAVTSQSNQNLQQNNAQSQENEKENAVFLLPTQPIVNCEDNEDGIFAKPTLPISKVNSQAVVLNAKTVQSLESSLNEDEGIFVQPTQPIISGNSQASEHDTNENVFMQPTQALESALDEELLNIVSSQPSESEDALFLQPTQPITKLNSQMNDEIFMQATEVLNPNTEQDVFLEPTQPLITNNEKLFKQPIPVNKMIQEKLETDDIYLEATQKVNLNEVLINDEENIENKLEKIFASQSITNPPVNAEIESQLEVVFESQNVSYRADVGHRPLNPILNELKGRKNEEFLNPEDPLLSDCTNEEPKVTSNAAVETFIGNSSYNSSGQENVITTKTLIKTNEFCEIDSSTNKNEDIHTKEDSSKDTKPRKSSLSLQKHKEENVDDYHLKSTLPSEELAPMPKNGENREGENIDNGKKNKVTKKSGKVTKENTNTKDQLKVLESLVPINEDEGKIETQEVIDQPVRTTRSRAICKSANKKQDKKTTGKNPVASSLKETRSKSKTCTTNSKNTAEMSLLEPDVKARPTRSAKAVNMNVLETDASITDNISVNDDTDSINDKRSKTRLAKNQIAKESDSSLEINLSKDVNVTKRQKRAAKTIINVSEASSLSSADSSADNSKDSNTIQNKKSRTRSAKTKNTNETNVSNPRNETAVSDLDVVENSTTNKPQPAANSNEKNEYLDLVNTVANKKSKTRVLKGKKVNTDDLMLNDEAVASTSNQTQTSKHVEVPGSNINDPIKSTLKTNKRKSTEEDIKQSDSSTEINESVTKRARRVNIEKSESGSSTLAPARTTRKKQILDSVVDSPQKKRRGKDAEIVNIQSEVSTPDRNRRKQKPKVVFTMLDSPELESVTRSLGGTIVNSVESCTVLVTGSLQRTQKLLSAVGQAKPICSPKWLQESKKASQFLDPWDHILEDKDAESNWKLSLKESLIKSRTQKLFQDYIVYITVTNSVDVLKAAIESCGGKCVTKAPRKMTNENFVVVANSENKSKYSKFLNQDPPIKIVLPEAIFDGVLRQELRFDEHSLS